MSMDALEVERLCEQLYGNSRVVDRDSLRSISERLEKFVQQTNCLVQCRLLLDRALTAYTQFFGANTLVKYLNQTSNQSTVSSTDRYELRSYIVEYLFKFQRNLATFVVAELIKLYARLTKISWFDVQNEVYPFQNVLDDLAKFRVDPGHFAISLQILIGLLSEMSVPNDDETSARAFSRHRKICLSFRDNKLIDVFLFSTQYLRDFILNQRKNLGLSGDLKDYPKTLHQIQLASDDFLVVERLLSLSYACLTYDFLGTGSLIYDVDISDENQVLQMPLSWHNYVIDGTYYQLFFSYYFFFSNTNLSAIGLSCLGQLCSVRRSLLNRTERLIVLGVLTSGMYSILEQSNGLAADEKSMHEFCRLIARLKANAQLHELISLDNYPGFIEKLFRFTVDQLLNIRAHRSFRLSPNTLHYGLSFWSKIVAYLSYNTTLSDTDGTPTENYLDTYIPQIVCYYIQSRLEALSTDDQLFSELFENDQAILQQQLDQISMMSRFEYGKTCALLCNCIDDTARQYQQASHSEAIERRLTFLVYALGGAIGASSISTSTSNEDQELYDGELVIRILQLMSYIQQRTASETQNHSQSPSINTALTTTTDRTQLTPYSERLELAILYFFEQFRKQYIGDHSRSNKIYQQLSNHLGVADEDQLLSIYVKKLFTNLQYSIITEKLIERTVSCFSDLAHGYQSVRKLAKLDPIQYFINHHTQDLFPFLSAASLANTQLSSSMTFSSWSRLRTTFYAVIGRMLMYEFRYEEDDDDERIESFMIPFTSQCRKLVQIFDEFKDLSTLSTSQWTASMMYNPKLIPLIELQSLITGLVRDLRGLCSSLISKPAYEAFFNWIYPSYLSIFVKALYLFYDQADVYNPLLKFFHEITSNRQERLVFDSMKASAYLLFRETCNVLVLFQTKSIAHLNSALSQNDQTVYYKAKLKPIITCLRIIQTCLAGNYVNFGVFHLYSDPCFENFLQVFFSLLTSIQPKELFAYPKLSSAYFNLIETFSLVRIEFLGHASVPLFGYVLNTIAEGIVSEQNDIQSSCCIFLDTFFSHVFRLVKKKCAPNNVMANLTEHETLFRQILVNILNGIILGESKNIYTLAKPLLGLILLNENKFFTEIKQQLLYGHPQQRQATLSTALDNLMMGIDRNLNERNKENFSQNLIQFRNDIQDSNTNTDEQNASSNSISSTVGVSVHIPVSVSSSNSVPRTEAFVSPLELMSMW